MSLLPEGLPSTTDDSNDSYFPIIDDFSNIPSITSQDIQVLSNIEKVSISLNFESITPSGYTYVGLETPFKTGWSNAAALMKNWSHGTSNCQNIAANLTKFRNRICYLASQTGVDAYWMLAMFAIESSGDPLSCAAYCGIAQTAHATTPHGNSLPTCETQVQMGMEHWVEMARLAKCHPGDIFRASLSYNAGCVLILDHLSDPGADMRTLRSCVAGYAASQGWNVAAKVSEITQYYPKILAAYRLLTKCNFLGRLGTTGWMNPSWECVTNEPSSMSTTAGSTISTKPDFETNEETDWLLEPSDDERKYGINIYDGQQPLIKFSTAHAIDGTETGNAVDALKKYATFLYYLLNSEVSTASVQCLSMPWIRPGFNVWYDPLYADRVYYCMGVQHQGTPGAGARTALTLVLGRPSNVFISDKEKFGSMKSGSDNVLINQLNEAYRVSKFGDIVDNESELNAIKEAMVSYYQSESFDTVSADHSPFHKELYGRGIGVSPLPDSIDKNKVFSGEYSKEEIESQLSAVYGGAPPVISDRVSKLHQSVSEAKKYIEQYHVMEHHTN